MSMDCFKIKIEKNCTISNKDPKKNNSPANELSYALSRGQTVNKNKLSNIQYRLLEALAGGNDCDTDDDIDILTFRDLVQAHKRYKTDTDVFRGLGVKEFRCDLAAGVANITTETGEVLRIDFGLNNNSQKSYTTKPKESKKTQKVKKQTDENKKKDIDSFLLALAQRESGGNHSIMNKFGYIGLYQVGEAALADVGVYHEKNKDYLHNDWKGIIKKNKYGITCLSDFRQSPEKQKAVQIDFKKRHWQYLKNLKLTQYVGKIINGQQITESGLLAGAHLVGIKGIRDYLLSNGKNDVTDANGTRVSSYIKKFAGYNINEITKT